MADTSFVDLTLSSPSRYTYQPSIGRSVPSPDSTKHPQPLEKHTMASRTLQLQQYIGTHWSTLEGADRKRAKEIAQRGNLGRERKADLGKWSVQHLEELYNHVHEVVHRGAVQLPQPAGTKHTTGPKAGSRHSSSGSTKTLELSQTMAQEREQERREQLERAKRHDFQGQEIRRQELERVRLSQQRSQVPDRPTQQPSASLPIPRPDQLRSVIMTTDANAVRDIFLQLCYSSPSLARAAVRTLAPHSTFAQATLRRRAAAAASQGPSQPLASPPPQSKHEVRASEVRPPEHVKPEPRTRMPELVPSRSRPTFRMPEVLEPSPVKQEKGAQAPNTVLKRNVSHSTVDLKRQRVKSPSLEPEHTVRQPLGPKSENRQLVVNATALTTGEKRKAADPNPNAHTGE
jgi:hypothetical protein